MILVGLLHTGMAAGTPQHLSLAVKGSLEATLVRAVPSHEGPMLSAEVARLLRWRGDVNRRVHPGDQLSLIYVSRAEGEPELLAMQYVGSELHLQAYRFADTDGISRFYDEAGGLIEPQLLNAPVPDYVQITELVQRGRGRRKHNGIDLKAPLGSPIRLPFAGTVNRINWLQRLNGRCIEVRYDNGILARFLHMSRIDPQVRPHVALPAGAPLGEVGSTGHSNAPHLHYELRRDDQPLDPLKIHGQRRAAAPQQSMAAFLVQRDALARTLVGPAEIPRVEFGKGAPQPSFLDTHPVPASPERCKLEPDQPLTACPVEPAVTPELR